MRLFIALDLAEPVRSALGDLIAQLKSKSRDARWVRTESMHLTLQFLGHTKPEKLNSIRAALESVHCDRPVKLRFQGVGFFPDERRPRVIWAGIEATPVLAELAAATETAIEPLGFERESRPYFPHITLARLSSNGAKGLVTAAEKLKSYDFGSAQESELHLFESVTKPSGAEYKKLATFSFVKGSK